MTGDGGPIRAYVVSPRGAGDEPLPTILDVHGGPLGAWGPLPPLEAILLAARGYRVVLPNPRGSYDQGAAWVRAAARRLGRRRRRRLPRRARRAGGARPGRSRPARRASASATAASSPTGSSARATASAPRSPRTASRTRCRPGPTPTAGPTTASSAELGDAVSADGVARAVAAVAAAARRQRSARRS